MGKIVVLLDAETRRKDAVINRLDEHADSCGTCAEAMVDPETIDFLCPVGAAIFDTM